MKKRYDLLASLLVLLALAGGVGASSYSGTGAGSGGGAGSTSLVVTKTSNYTVLSGDSSTVFTNAGAVAEVDFALPAWSSGLRYTFVVEASQVLKVIANGTDTITIGNNTTSAGGNTRSSTIGSAVHVVATASGKWRADSATINWSTF